MSDDQDQTPSILFPVICSLLASICTSSSFVIMKYAHNLVQSQGLKKWVYLNPYWLLGFFNLLIGSLFNIIALGLGDQILFSITSSFSIVLNTVFSVTFLRESLILSDFLAICIICIGSTLFLLTAKNDDEELTSEKLY